MDRSLVCKYGESCGHEFCSPELCPEHGDPERGVGENLALIRSTLNEILPETVKIMDIVYRDQDLGVNGFAGYSFYLIKADQTGGLGGTITTVNEAQIKDAAAQLIDRLERKKT